MLNVHLVIIDPQNDFCDPKGSLFVPGAEEDVKRLASFVDQNSSKLSAIHVTLDSHRPIDIAHPVFWVDPTGKNPAPFTIINASEVRSGFWRTKMPGLQKRASDYVESLEANSRYPLCIWPPHCLIGSWGHNVAPELHKSLTDWEEKRFRSIDFVTKGSNPFTEHYSAVKADVPDPQDPSTLVNSRFIKVLMDADEVLVTGEAGSHCLANTVRDIAREFGDDSYVKKLTLLEDGTSPVPGFANLQDDFINEMVGRGMKVSTTKTWMASQPITV